MGSCALIVGEVRGQRVTQVPLAENDDMVEALAAHRADEALRERILPWAVWRREDFRDLPALHTMPEVFAVDPVSIAQEIGRRGVVRESVHDLLGGPVGGGALGHVEVDDAPAMVSEHDEDEEDAQAYGRHHEEIEGDQIADMVGEERPPRLGRRGAPLGKQSGDGALGHIDAELEELTMDSRRAQRGFAVAMRVTSALISAWTGGRPPVGRLESLAQYSR
jgi:hypothetical protein